MIDRLAFFASKEEFEEYFNLLTGKKAIFEPHYNLAPAQEIPVLLTSDDNEVKILRARWGINSDNPSATGTHNISVEDAKDKIKSKDYSACIIPVSGFYIWKKDNKEKQPFFVRMLNDPVMAIAGLVKTAPETNKLQCTLITTEANALLQPLVDLMPLLFKSALARTWLTKPEEQQDVLLQAEKLFLLTEMTVHRVSKKVNDISNNDPNLVQPIPK